MGRKECSTGLRITQAKVNTRRNTEDIKVETKAKLARIKGRPDKERPWLGMAPMIQKVNQRSGRVEGLPEKVGTVRNRLR